LTRISELLASPGQAETTSPVHRSSVKVRLDNSGSRTRIVSPPAVNDVTPMRSSEDLRFVSTKSLNLQPVTPQSAKSSALSPPLKSGHLPAGTATVPSSGGGRYRTSQRDQAAAGRPQRYQSTDAFVITTPNVAAPPDVISSLSVSSVSSSSRRADEKCIDEDWQRMVAAASSDQINLVSFHDTNNTMSGNSQFSSADAVSYTSSTVPRHSSSGRRGTDPGTVIFTLQASPPVKGRAAGVTLRSIQDVCVTTDSPPLPSKPLSFANPLYSQGTKVDTSQRSRPSAVTQTESNVQSGVPSDNSASHSHYAKRPQVLPITPASIGIGRSRQYRDLAGSTESLDSVLVSRPASKHRGPIRPSLSTSSHFSQSASHIDRHPPPVAPRRPKLRSFESGAPATVAGRGIDQRESNFGALKRLWQSIELPASPSTSSGSTTSYQSPARMTRSHITQRQLGTHLHSASFDGGLSDFGSTAQSTRRGHSCDSLLTGDSVAKSQQLKDNRNLPPSLDVEDQSEV